MLYVKPLLPKGSRQEEGGQLLPYREVVRTTPNRDIETLVTLCLLLLAPGTAPLGTAGCA